MTTLLLSIHILSIALWIGGSVMNGILNMRVANAGRTEASATLARVEVNLGQTYYMPVAILTLLSGIGLVLTGDSWSFGDVWVSFGFLVVIVSAVLGPTRFLPLSRAIADAYESGDTAAAEASSKQIAMWSAINTALLVLATILMVAKP